MKSLVPSLKVLVITLILLAVALLSLPFAASASQEESAIEDPRLVAVIDRGPGRIVTEITRAQFRRAFSQQWRMGGLSRPPKPGSKSHADVKETAINDLLNQAWLAAEGAEMKIKVSARQITRAYRDYIRENFDGRRGFQTFLRNIRMTQKEIRSRVRLMLTSLKIVERVTAGAKNKTESRKLLDQYVVQYTAKWASRTECAPGFIVNMCSNYKGSASKEPPVPEIAPAAWRVGQILFWAGRS